VATIINGFAFPSKHFKASKGFPLVRIRDVVDGQSDTLYDGPIPDGYWVQDGDLLVGMDGEFNCALWRGGKALLNQRVCKIVPDETRLRKQFLLYALPGYLKLINDYTSSVTVKHLSSRTLQQVPLPLPALDEQDRLIARIDALFAEIDEGEAALAEARAGVETYRKALLKAAVTGELTAEWRRDNPPQETGEQLLQRILADRRARWHADPKNARKKYIEPVGPDTDGLPELPEGWAWASVACVVEATTYGTSTKCDRNSAGVPVLRMGNIQDGRLDLGDLKYAPESSGLPRLQAGEVLFNRTNSAELLGKSAVYDGDPAICSYASYLVGVRLAYGEPHFFAAWLNSIFGKAWVAENKSQQVGQANLSAGKLMQMPLPVAPMEEQRVVVQRLNEALSRANDQLVDGPAIEGLSSTLRQSILAAAFRGELAA